jgi:hypothetical protein
MYGMKDINKATAETLTTLFSYDGGGGGNAWREGIGAERSSGITGRIRNRRICIDEKTCVKKRRSFYFFGRISTDYTETKEKLYEERFYVN